MSRASHLAPISRSCPFIPCTSHPPPCRILPPLLFRPHPRPPPLSSLPVFSPILCSTGAFANPEEMHPRFQEFIARVAVFRHHTRMEDFGGDTEKGLWLYSNSADISAIELYRPEALEQIPPTHRPKLIETYTDARGHQKVQGNKARLKSSQEYTAQFGTAVVQWYRDRAGEFARLGMERVGAYSQTSVPCARVAPDACSDADLDACFELFKKP